jgi:putative spermidine/putrescine transport system substrate-binding protein
MDSGTARHAEGEDGMRKVFMALVALVTTLGFVSVASLQSGASAKTKWRTATSAKAGGGMKALIKAAKKEGKLNVIALPPTWANYGTIMKEFQHKYHIKITDANPTGSSAQEVAAINQLKGQTRAPDVVDVGNSFAVTGVKSGLWAPYKVATWKTIPNSAKTAHGNWYDDYGGYVAIGYTGTKVKNPPKSFKDLLKSTYKNQVGINTTPTEASAAFAAVLAAALANGGSLSNIAPGVTYFKKLYSVGNFVPTKADPATVENGTTPIVIWWDYLQASEIASKLPDWKVVIPTDGHYAAFYTQAINRTAPHPAAARLWEEFVYSKIGQNDFLKGKAEPIEMQALIKHHTITAAAKKALPPTPPGKLELATSPELTKDATVLAHTWSLKVTS